MTAIPPLVFLFKITLRWLSLPPPPADSKFTQRTGPTSLPGRCLLPELSSRFACSICWCPPPLFVSIVPACSIAKKFLVDTVTAYYAYTWFDCSRHLVSFAFVPEGFLRLRLFKHNEVSFRQFTGSSSSGNVYFLCLSGTILRDLLPAAYCHREDAIDRTKDSIPV